jgi:flagellar protein FlaG
MDVMATGAFQAPAAAKTPASPTDGRPLAAQTADGKNLPPAGKVAPAHAPAMDVASIEKAVEQINSYLRDSKRQIEFQMDQASGRTVMRMVDASGQLIRQVPSEVVLAIAAALDSRGFHSVSDLA